MLYLSFFTCSSIVGKKTRMKYSNSQKNKELSLSLDNPKSEFFYLPEMEITFNSKSLPPLTSIKNKNKDI